MITEKCFTQTKHLYSFLNSQQDSINLPNHDSLLQIIPKFAKSELLKVEAPSITSGVISSPADFLEQTQSIFQQTNVSLSVKIKNIPFNSSLLTNSIDKLEFQKLKNDFIGSLQFNKEDYERMLMERINSQFEVKIKKVLENKIADAKSVLISKMKSEFSNLKNNVDPKVLEIVGGDPVLFLKDDRDNITKRLKETLLDETNKYKELSTQIKERAKLGENRDKGLLDSINIKLSKNEEYSKMLDKVVKFKEKYKKSEDFIKLAKLQESLDSKLGNLKENPAEIRKMAANYLDLKGIDRIFLVINDLKTGRIESSLSKLSMNGYNMNGISMELAKGKKYLMLAGGFENNFSNPWDNQIQPFRSALMSSCKGITFGKGELNEPHTHLSVYNYLQQSQDGNVYLLNNNTVLPVKRVTNVFTLSQQINILDDHILKMEVSKSFSKLGSDKDVKVQNEELSNNRGVFSQMAFTINYVGEFKKIKLQSKINLAYVAPDYTNPGSFFLNRGSKEGFLEIKKQFKKRKYQIGVRGLYKEFCFSANSALYSKNYYLNVDGRVNFKRNQYIAFHYQPNTNYRYTNDFSGIFGETNKVSFDGAFVPHVLKQRYRNQLNLISQTSSFLTYDNKMVSTKMINIISSQSFSLNSNIVSWNTIYTNVSQSNLTPLLATSLYSEIGLSYNLLKKVDCSSSLLYQNYKDYQSQIGIRQKLSFSLTRIFEASIFADLRKSVGKGREEKILNNQRFEIQFKYNFMK